MSLDKKSSDDLNAKSSTIKNVALASLIATWAYATDWKVSNLINQSDSSELVKSLNWVSSSSKDALAKLWYELDWNSLKTKKWVSSILWEDWAYSVSTFKSWDNTEGNIIVEKTNNPNKESDEAFAKTIQNNVSDLAKWKYTISKDGSFNHWKDYFSVKWNATINTWSTTTPSNTEIKDIKATYVNAVSSNLALWVTTYSDKSKSEWGIFYTASTKMPNWDMFTGQTGVVKKSWVIWNLSYDANIANLWVNYKGTAKNIPYTLWGWINKVSWSVNPTYWNIATGYDLKLDGSQTYANIELELSHKSKLWANVYNTKWIWTEYWLNYASWNLNTYYKNWFESSSKTLNSSWNSLDMDRTLKQSLWMSLNLKSNWYLVNPKLNLEWFKKSARFAANTVDSTWWMLTFTSWLDSSWLNLKTSDTIKVSNLSRSMYKQDYLNILNNSSHSPSDKEYFSSELKKLEGKKALIKNKYSNEFQWKTMNVEELKRVISDKITKEKEFLESHPNATNDYLMDLEADYYDLSNIQNEIDAINDFTWWIVKPISPKEVAMNAENMIDASTLKYMWAITWWITVAAIASSWGGGGGWSSSPNTPTSSPNVAPTRSDFTYWTSIGNSSKTFNWLTLSSAADANSDTLTATVKTDWTKWSFNVSWNNLTYNPNASMTGSDSWVITISDGHGWTKDVTITVNDIDTVAPLYQSATINVSSWTTWSGTVTFSEWSTLSGLAIINASDNTPAWWSVTVSSWSWTSTETLSITAPNNPWNFVKIRGTVTDLAWNASNFETDPWQL